LVTFPSLRYCFQWATDYPHNDHPASWATNLQRFVAPLSEDTRRRVLGQNVKDIYRLN
jgi:predicted TIM-barrel fold metal-dependent hydrolase